MNRTSSPDGGRIPGEFLRHYLFRSVRFSDGTTKACWPSVKAVFRFCAAISFFGHLPILQASNAMAQQIIAVPNRGSTYLIYPQPQASQLPLIVQLGVGSPGYVYQYPYPYPYSYLYPYLGTYQISRVGRDSSFDLGKVTPAGRLIIKVQPEDSEVFVDGFQLESSLGETYDLSVLVGPHRIEARRESHSDFTRAVEVKKNDQLLVTIRLKRLSLKNPR